MQNIIIGEGKPKIGIVGCLHGNERIGAEVIASLKTIKLNSGSLILVIANEEAMRQDKRFIDTDLNRCFPGKEECNHEEMLAFQLTKALKDCDYVIDVHSTTADTESFAIITKDNAKEIAQNFLKKKLVDMGETIASGKSLIDNVKCGVSIEFNKETPFMDVKEAIMNFLKSIGMVEGEPVFTEMEVFSVYGKLEGEGVLDNFKEITLDNETFYPVLSGTKEYKGVICLKARRGVSI